MALLAGVKSGTRMMQEQASEASPITYEQAVMLLEAAFDEVDSLQISYFLQETYNTVQCTFIPHCCSMLFLGVMPDLGSY